MRRYGSPDGQAWDVVVGRESWGALFAIFVPKGGDAQIRQAPLSASSYEEATATLERLDDEEVAALFERSRPKPL